MRGCFGHIAGARHFQNAARRCGFIELVENLERRVEQMEKNEMEYWQWIESLGDKWVENYINQSKGEQS